MDADSIRIRMLEPLRKRVRMVGAVVVHDPEHPIRAGIRLGDHSRLDQRFEVVSRVPVDHVAVHSGLGNVQHRPIDDRSLAVVGVLDQVASAWRHRAIVDVAFERLHTRLFVRTHHDVARFQLLPGPHPLEQVQGGRRIPAEVRRSRRHTASLCPGLEASSLSQVLIVDREGHGSSSSMATAWISPLPRRVTGCPR